MALVISTVTFASNKMVFKGRIDCDARARIYYLSHVRGLSVRKVAHLCGVSRSSVFRIAQEGGVNKPSLRPASRKGRPRKLTERQKRLITRSILMLRTEEGNFSAARIMEHAGIDNSEVSVRTVTRFLNEKGYYYLQARKKGLLKRGDLKTRLSFAKWCKKDLPENFWTEHLSFFLDGTGFAHKSNPCEQARATKGRTWRKISEGLVLGCTSKGRKEGTGGKVLRLVVAISYGKGVIICEPYEKMTGAYFSNFIDRNFNTMFQTADKGNSRIWVQDGDPSQNSAIAKSAMSRANSTLLKLPPRSPDLHPIENLFHIASNKLKQQAVSQNITKESFEQFKQRAVNTMYSIRIETINNLIESMNVWLNDVIRYKGNCTRY